MWAIQQYGFNAVIAPSFTDIFRNNCTKNGLVPVVAAGTGRRAIWAAIEAEPTPRSSSTWSASSSRCRRSASSSRSRSTRRRSTASSNGLDDVGITLTHADEITDYEAKRPAWLP